MLIKLECYKESIAQRIERERPYDTIRMGKAVICIDIPLYELACIQHEAGAYTVHLSDYDRHCVRDYIKQRG